MSAAAAEAMALSVDRAQLALNALCVCLPESEWGAGPYGDEVAVSRLVADCMHFFGRKRFESVLAGALVRGGLVFEQEQEAIK